MSRGFLEWRIWAPDSSERDHKLIVVIFGFPEVIDDIAQVKEKNRFIGSIRRSAVTCDLVATRTSLPYLPSFAAPVSPAAWKIIFSADSISRIASVPWGPSADSRL